MTESIEREFTKAQRSSDFAIHQAFVERLVATHDRERVKFHYELLRERTNYDLYLMVRAAFDRHGKEGESFLCEHLPTEKDQDVASDAMLILGLMRSSKARDLALGFLGHSAPKERHMGCVVLGWVGTKADEPILAKILVSDVDARVRGTAATALRQMWHRIPAIKFRVLKLFREALEAEGDTGAQSDIIIATQSVLGKKLGLVEDIEQGEVRGDLAQAREKARKALTSVKR
jgi:HEAT repeats